RPRQGKYVHPTEGLWVHWRREQEAGQLLNELSSETGRQQTPLPDPPAGEQSDKKGPTASSPAKQRPNIQKKEPSPDAIAPYRPWLVTGEKQEELAARMTNGLKHPISQGQVSRWLKQVRDWLKAGNVLPDLPNALDKKPMPMDPERIDLGERQDGLAKRQ